LLVDLNCDMGEGMETDAAIFPFISSANIACGAHAGDRDIMRRTVELAVAHGVAVGAHPSYPDRERFGRVDILGKPASAAELSALQDSLFEQLRALSAVCRGLGVHLHHVKPHGALYNRAAWDVAVAALVCHVVADFDTALLLYGLSGSLMEPAATAAGLGFVSEVFADRSYRPDGSLTPRTEPGALIEDGPTAVAQAMKMVRDGRVAVAGGGDILLHAATICLHGDGTHAVEFARMIHGALSTEGVRIAAPGQD
jgi:UPF0271 protein